jgi:hypothetical protein
VEIQKHIQEIEAQLQKTQSKTSTNKSTPPIHQEVDDLIRREAQNARSTPELTIEIKAKITGPERPKKPVNIKQFATHSMQEYITFFNHLEAYFEEYRDWFKNKENHIHAASAQLIDTRHNKWQTHKAKLAKTPKWSDFQDFCLRLVSAPKRLHEEVAVQYFTATQLEHQSV